MTKDQIKARLLDHIKTYRNVSFAELDRVGLGDWRGTCSIEIKGNLVIWANLSSDVADAVIELYKAKEIDFTPCSTMVYMADGVCLQLPLAKRPPINGYTKPHWAPVVMTPAPAKH